MVNRMIEMLSQTHRDYMLLEVRETNLPAQLFFRSQGFRATEVLREHYEDTREDAYLMQYRYGDSNDWIIPISRKVS